LSLMMGSCSRKDHRCYPVPESMSWQKRTRYGSFVHYTNFAVKVKGFFERPAGEGERELV